MVYLNIKNDNERIPGEFYTSYEPSEIRMPGNRKSS